AEDGIRDRNVTGVQTCALPILSVRRLPSAAILKERLLEFAAEGKRRTDMIRHGKFTTWTESIKNGVCGASGTCGAARAAFRILFPIPATQLGSNPLLTQNAGY